SMVQPWANSDIFRDTSGNVGGPPSSMDWLTPKPTDGVRFPALDDAVNVRGWRTRLYVSHHMRMVSVAHAPILVSTVDGPGMPNPLPGDV
ncbi:MAG: hypothetical protein AVDCRST_MAG87-3517, partial [uncultured Thermomicrobiales bacterium]